MYLGQGRGPWGKICPNFSQGKKKESPCSSEGRDECLGGRKLRRQGVGEVADDLEIDFLKHAGSPAIDVMVDEKELTTKGGEKGG